MIILAQVVRVISAFFCIVADKSDDRKTIVLNLHLLDKEQALRIVDFLCGATHALSGSQQKIGDSVFIFTPVNVALSAESQKSKFLRDALWNQPQA